MKTIDRYQPNVDHLRVYAATPEVSIADPGENTKRILSLFMEASSSGASLVVFPELSITGYSIGDLVQSPRLLQSAKDGLNELAQSTAGINTAMVVGLPLAVDNGLYNCAAFLADGTVKGIVPKTHLPTYKEFYEKRWYQSWQNENISINIDGVVTIFGTNQLFNIGSAAVGIEICEDLWNPQSPSDQLAANGAVIIVNPSASPEIASKQAYRRNLVSITAGKLACAYVYAGADSSESTMDIVMSGHSMINESGRLLAERMPFTQGERLITADIDIAHLVFDRRQNTNYPTNHTMTRHDTTIIPSQTELERYIEPHPFIPEGSAEVVAERLNEILNIQSIGLAQRLASVPAQRVHLGLSGGLDSTLALLVAEQAARRLGKTPRDVIATYTMPADASSDRTQNNAQLLAASLGVANKVIPISNITEQQLLAIDHSGSEDVTFENTQARIRTALLFNEANQHGGIVLGTGDLSEIALGWSTYNGDHMSHYNVNSSIPKTLVRYLVEHAAQNYSPDTAAILRDILETPVSPELVGNGELHQATEDILGPYELHDFFLYHFIRYQDSPEKIRFLACNAFTEYTPDQIDTCLDIFIKRFYNNQWKRSVMPDGPKVGTVSLSPRGDWRMPSDANTAGKIHY